MYRTLLVLYYSFACIYILNRIAEDSMTSVLNQLAWLLVKGTPIFKHLVQTSTVYIYIIDGLKR